MFLSIAGLALALQLGPPAQSLNENVPLAQEVQYRVPVHPPPCGHGWDVGARDGMCYPNGYLVDQIQHFDSLWDSPKDRRVRVWGMHERTNIQLSRADRASSKPWSPTAIVRKSTFGGQESSF